MNHKGIISRYAEDLGYLIASSISRKILYALKFGYETPTSISKFLRISLSNVSTKLSELKRRGIVICINPERRKGRIYIITDKGELLLKNLPNGYKTGFNINYESEI